MNLSVRLSPRKNNERKMGKRKRTKGSSRRGVSLVHWFRNKGLRLDDNPALKEALVGAKTFRCVYILDPWFARSPNQGVNKWRFLLQCLVDLDSSLRKLNSRLFLIRGQPSDVFPKLFKEWGVNRLSFEEDPEVFGKQRDAKIKMLAATFQVQVITRLSHTLYDPKEILSVNSNNPPLTYKHFQYLISLLDPPPFPEDTITLADIEGVNTAIMSDHDSKYGLSSLEELGFDTEDLQPPVWIGGETVAKQRLDRHLERKAWVANFERPRMSGASLMASPTGLGPYLRFGCLSPRLFYWRLTELYRKMKKTTDIPLYLHGQLYWREFFFTLGYNNAKLDQMIDNPICIPIPWEVNDEKLQQWRNGETGFPWIDAIMIQLRQEGWIHPIARHAVACFLTRGDLWISWEEGAKVFEDLLLDADWSVNAGNWIWLSCSSFHQQFFHCYKFCPVMFSQQTDPNGDYVRKYIPALKNFSAKYIYNPWKAPLDVQEKAKCVIGKDYPLPMVNHDKVSRINSERMKKILQSVARKPCYDESFTASTLHTKVQNRHRVPNMQKEPPRKLARLTQDHLSTHPNNYMPAQDDLTAGTSSYMRTQDDLTTGNNSYMPTQDELSVGTNSYLQTQDELTAGNNSYMQTQDELTAGTMSYMPTRDELTAGINSYFQTQDDLSAGTNSYMQSQDESTAGNNSYMPAQDELTAGNNSYMQTQDELTAGTMSYMPTRDELTAGTNSYFQTQDDLSAGTNSYMQSQDESTAGTNSYMPTQDELTTGTNSYLQSQDD